MLVQHHGVLFFGGAGGPIRQEGGGGAAGAGEGHHAFEDDLLHPGRVIAAVGVIHQLDVAEHVGDIAAVPGAQAAEQGLVHVEQVRVRMLVQRGAGLQVGDRGLAENGVQAQQVGQGPFGIAHAEQLFKGRRIFLAQVFFDQSPLLRLRHGVLIEGRGAEGREFAVHRADQEGHVLGFPAEALRQGIAQVMCVRERRLAHVPAFLAEIGRNRVIGFRQGGEGNGFQLFDRLDTQLFHDGFRQLLAAALRVRQRADDAAHVVALGVQAVGLRALQQGGHLGTAAGLAEHGHVVRVAAEAFDIVPDPLEGRDDVVAARVAGVFVFVAEIGKIKIAQDVQPVVDADHHGVPVQGHVVPVVGDLLDGGTGAVPAAVQPHEHGALFPVQRGRPDIQVQAVLAERPEAVRHIDFALRIVLLQQGAHIAVAGGVQHVLMPGRGLRGVETGGLRVRDAAEGQDALVLKAPDRALGGFHHGELVVVTKFAHADAPFLR